MPGESPPGAGVTRSDRIPATQRYAVCSGDNDVYPIACGNGETHKAHVLDREPAPDERYVNDLPREPRHAYTVVAGNDADGCHLDTPTRHPCGRPGSDPVHDGVHVVSRAGGGAGGSGSVPDQIASTVTGAGSGSGSAYVTPRLIAGKAPLATRTCGHGKVARYNFAVPGGYCRHDDGTECDPMTLMATPIAKIEIDRVVAGERGAVVEGRIPRGTLPLGDIGHLSVGPTTGSLDLLGDPVVDFSDAVRQAYADRVADYVARTAAAPARCAARWLVDDGPRLPLEYVCDEDAHPGSRHKWRAVPAVPAPAHNGHYGVCPNHGLNLLADGSCLECDAAARPAQNPDYGARKRDGYLCGHFGCGGLDACCQEDDPVSDPSDLADDDCLRMTIDGECPADGSPRCTSCVWRPADA